MNFYCFKNTDITNRFYSDWCTAGTNRIGTKLVLQIDNTVPICKKDMSADDAERVLLPKQRWQNLL
jgi:hypothetical protein